MFDKYSQISVEIYKNDKYTERNTINRKVSRTSSIKYLKSREESD